MTRVSVLVQSVPFPPTHGGLVDSWNVIRALKSCGASVQLVYWLGARDELTDVQRGALWESVDDLVELRRRDGAWRAFNLRMPPWMLSHTLTREGHAGLCERVAAFGADWVLLDAWLAALPAMRLARDLRLPLVYRSQNIEHEYLSEIARRSSGVRRLKIWLNALRMSRAEAMVRATADLVCDIAPDDLAFWQRRGLAANAMLLPPLWFGSDAARVVSERDIDVLFVGNLRTPNNVEGVRWFLERCLPLVRVLAARPLRVVVAGSQPSVALVLACSSAGVECMANPESVGPLYARTKVAINPLRVASGVNLKMIEIFASGCAAVSTSAGFRGMPAEARSAFVIADEPESFAAAVWRLQVQNQTTPAIERQAAVERLFGPQLVQSVIDRVRSLGSGAVTPLTSYHPN